jgi:GNAT superfamily N-acetyltransferase
MRNKRPSDTAMCLEADCEPYILWGEIPASQVVKVFDKGFMIYEIWTHDIELKKLCVLEEYRRMGYGRSALDWLADRARELNRRLIAKLTETQALDSGMGYLLLDRGFRCDRNYLFVRRG